MKQSTLADALRVTEGGRKANTEACKNIVELRWVKFYEEEEGKVFYFKIKENMLKQRVKQES